ncbi:uncharacterized protein L199_008102 [Kwoniella botswanensis]|uniref:uncharacterized protein n=1 Tax=Kwoniella botswanensis TaxID=1268659 RepID=UPI00315C4FC3
MSSSPSPSTPTNGNTFLNAAYRNISADPDKSKISRLMSHVNTHALTQHMPAFPGYWMMQTDPVGITQYVRLDQVTGEGGQTESGTRGRLKGNYPRTKSIRSREDQEKQTEDEGLGTGVITELTDIGAYIIPIEERDSTITNSDSKGTNKKKKNSKKNKKKKGKQSITSSTNTAEEEKEEEEEAEGRDDEEEQKKDASDVYVVLGSNNEASGDEGKKKSVIEEEATEIITKDENFQGGDDDTQNETRVLSPPPEPAQPEGKEEPTSINLDTQVPSQRADDIVPSTSTSPIKVKLPPPSTPPSQPRRFENNIIYFGEIPTRYFNSAEQEPLSRSNSTEEGDINTPIIGSLDTFSHTPESITPRQEPSPSSSMSNPTPPQSPPIGECTPQVSSININRVIYSEPSSVITAERPLTPPSEVDEDEEDGKLVFPSDSPQATQPHIISRPLVNPPPIPSITLNTPTSPAMFTSTFHPLTHSWTMYFSNTAHQHQRKASMPALSPLNPLSSHPNASDYSSHLVTLFKADNLEDLFGGWKALRRSIAKSKRREIEPIGDSVQKGGPGLGTHLFQEETNIYIFKSHIRPMWEDKYCQKGGKIMIAGEASAMDDLFLELIFLLISGDLEDEVPPPPGSSSTICGLVLSRRKLTRIEMWLGGENVIPDKRWVEQVTRYIQVKFKEWRVYPYKAFGKS